ncbi:DUF397 domain-containing protein [Streptomyces sp. NPDC001922]|uniref:DUF397 domain-containing protein n=1 Tax=Streptomyces sp. NPDC001922 TaxID=3364624 RepID=UPI0036A6C902
MNQSEWQKSSYCQGVSNCLNLALGADGVLLLCESEDPETVLKTTPERLRAFFLGVKAGEFDHFVT